MRILQMNTFADPVAQFVATTMFVAVDPGGDGVAMWREEFEHLAVIP